MGFANHLRDHQTPGERMFGRVLAHLGIEAEPQVIIGPYVVDWVDQANRVVMEIDGPSHVKTGAYDQRRTRWLESKGYRVMRFTNEEVRHLMNEIAREGRSE